MTIVLNIALYLAICCAAAAVLTFALNWAFKRVLREFEGFFQ